VISVVVGVGAVVSAVLGVGVVVGVGGLDSLAVAGLLGRAERSDRRRAVCVCMWRRGEGRGDCLSCAVDFLMTYYFLLYPYCIVRNCKSI
jgi:hypothetical protein